MSLLLRQHPGTGSPYMVPHQRLTNQLLRVPAVSENRGFFEQNGGGILFICMYHAQFDFVWADS